MGDQDPAFTTWTLQRVRFAISGIDANLGQRNTDSFLQNVLADLKADFILANPPLNMSDSVDANLRQDARWEFGMPPVNNSPRRRSPLQRETTHRNLAALNPY
jgi:type I restriction enzyme M protein